MPDKKLKTQSPRATLASVKKEMALPRESKSAREALALMETSELEKNKP
jgi:hypothetical protein